MLETLSLQRRPVEAHKEIPSRPQAGARADTSPRGRAAHLAEERPRQEGLFAGGLRPVDASSGNGFDSDSDLSRSVGSGHRDYHRRAHHHHARSRSEQVFLPASSPTSGEAVRVEGHRVGADPVGILGRAQIGDDSAFSATTATGGSATGHAHRGRRRGDPQQQWRRLRRQSRSLSGRQHH